MSTPTLWSILRNDDGGGAIVVPEGMAPAEALRRLVEEEYGGEFAADNPVIVAAAQELKVRPWRECSPEQAQDYGADLDAYNSWWAPGGCGSEVIYVLNYDGDIYGLGEDAEAAEVSA